MYTLQKDVLYSLVKRDIKKYSLVSYTKKLILNYKKINKAHANTYD
jgi:hypothetical protein